MCDYDLVLFVWQTLAGAFLLVLPAVKAHQSRGSAEVCSFEVGRPPGTSSQKRYPVMRDVCAKTLFAARRGSAQLLVRAFDLFQPRGSS